MRKLAITFMVLALFCLSPAKAHAQSEAAIENSIVKIFTVANDPDYLQPWQMLGQKSFSGSGCILEGNRILTNAHVVANQTFIQVLKSGGTKKYPAQVVAVDHDCDLAILTIKDSAFFKDSAPLEFGELPNLGEHVKAYGFPEGGQKLSITEGVVSRIEVNEYAHSGRKLLTVQIDAAINPGNSGGPVLAGNRIVGVAFQGLEKSQNIGYAVPVTVVKHFLADLKNKKYGGFPSLGVDVQTLENDTARKMLGMSGAQTGILASRISFGSSAWGNLEENDVILSIDGVNIGNDGTVPFGNKGRIEASYIVSSKFVGDTVSLKVLRNGHAMDISFPLKKEAYIVPESQYDVRPKYYIFGGVVFTVLTLDYLRRLPENLMQASITLGSMYLNEIMTPRRQEIVIVQQILSDELNIGYEDCTNMAVEKINGQPVATLKDLVGKIEGNSGEYIIIGLENNKEIILDYKKSMENTAGILSRYRIPFDRSDNLK